MVIEDNVKLSSVRSIRSGERFCHNSQVPLFPCQWSERADKATDLATAAVICNRRSLDDMQQNL